jgi:putative oxidoreductase
MNTIRLSTVHGQGTLRYPGRSKRAAVDVIGNASELAGRVFVAAIFLISGFGKIGAYAATAAYMASAGVPPALLPAVIATEALGGIAILLGWHVRIAASLLAGFTLLAGLIFHSHFGDQIQMIMFLKNVAIAGGLLVLLANGPGAWSLDRRSPQHDAA